MHLKNSKIIVIKIGSSLIVDKRKKVRKKWLLSFAKDIRKLKSKNKDLPDNKKLDFDIWLDKKNNIQISNVAFPILFLPFVSRASEIIGKRIFLKIEEKEFLLNLNQSIYSNYLKNEVLEICNTINISFIENNNSFNENEWKELYKLSEDTFVEETDSLKIGAAGAGLTDND